MKNCHFASIFLGFCALTLAACFPLSEDQCKSADWQSIGRADGARGRDAQIFSTYVKDCSEFGITPDREAWQKGHAQGLQTYCTPRNAYREGQRGRRVKEICPNQNVLDRPNRAGLQYHELDKEINDLRDERSDIRDEMQRINDIEDADERRRLYRFYIRQYDRLERQIDRLQIERAALPVYN